MRKAYIDKSLSRNGCFRMISNINEDYSIGVILTPAELQELQFDIKSALSKQDIHNKLEVELPAFLSEDETIVFMKLLKKISDYDYLTELINETR